MWQGVSFSLAKQVVYTNELSITALLSHVDFLLNYSTFETSIATTIRWKNWNMSRGYFFWSVMVFRAQKKKLTIAFIVLGVIDE